MINKPTQIYPEPKNNYTLLKLWLLTVFCAIVITTLHAREVREQWKETHDTWVKEQIELATGGYGGN